MSKTISIQQAANGCIVTEANDVTLALPSVFEATPPHVFETFDALVGFLRSRMPPAESEQGKPEQPQNAQPTPTGGAPSFPSDQMTGIYCDSCKGRCRFASPVDAYGNLKTL